MGNASIVDHDHATLGTYNVHCDQIIITIIVQKPDIFYIWGHGLQIVSHQSRILNI